MLLRMVLGRTRRELSDVFSQFIDDVPGRRPPSEAAFCKARLKLKPGLFRELILSLSRRFYRHRVGSGFRLVAVDGAMVNLPDTTEIREHYGPASKGPGREGAPQARLSVCYEVEDRVVLDARLTTFKIGERKSAKRHFRLLRPGDLVLMDMGYFGFAMLHDLLGSDLEFVMRVPPACCREVSAFVASSKQSAIITIARGSRHDRLRAVRIELENGTLEILLTNLNDSLYDQDFFRDIYACRWGVETFYDHLKNAAELENLSGRSPLKVQQEIYAKILLCSLAAMLAAPLRPALRSATRRCKLTYQISMRDAIAYLRRAIVGLLVNPADQVRESWQQFAQQLLHSRSPIRPGRSFPRNFKTKPPRFLQNRKRI